MECERGQPARGGVAAIAARTLIARVVEASGRESLREAYRNLQRESNRLELSDFLDGLDARPPEAQAHVLRAMASCRLRGAARAIRSSLQSEHAIVRRSAAEMLVFDYHDLEAKTFTVGELLSNLLDDRVWAIRLLHSVTRFRVGYDPTDTEEERVYAQKKWVRWLETGGMYAPGY